MLKKHFEGEILNYKLSLLQITDKKLLRLVERFEVSVAFAILTQVGSK